MSDLTANCADRPRRTTSRVGGADASGRETERAPRWWLLLCLPLALHLLVPWPAEPVFNGDANRHVMTSVFFRDLLTDLPLSDPKGYATDYYEQYPALGLLIWPPLFHGLTGGLMWLSGTSVWVARGVVFCSYLAAAVLLKRICARRLAADVVPVVVLLFLMLPMVFQYGRYVMLEMTTLAFCLGCLDQFDLWLRSPVAAEAAGPNRVRHRNLYLAAVCAALAALTRFDAVVLLPTLLLLALLQRQTGRLRSLHTFGAAMVAIVLVAPTYALIWKEMGDLHLRQATESVGGEESSWLAEGCWTFYLKALPDQTGWPFLLFLTMGLVAAVRSKFRSMAIFVALLAGTYLTFSPLAELRARHTIYWLPALAAFAAVGGMQVIHLLTRCWPTRQLMVSSLVLTALFVGTSQATLRTPLFIAKGYSTAATRVLQSTRDGDAVLVDAWWDGNLIYHLRHLDPGRSRQVRRGDKLLYDFTSVPNIDFQSFVHSDEDILRSIAAADIACVVFEDPQPFSHIPVSQQLRTLIHSLPEVFVPIETVDVDVRFPQARPFCLRIFEVDRDRLHQLLQQYEYPVRDGGATDKTAASTSRTMRSFKPLVFSFFPDWHNILQAILPDAG